MSNLLPPVEQWIPTRITPLMMKRAVARVLDLMLMFALALILPGVLGPIVAFTYSLCGDAMSHLPVFREKLTQYPGQSLGKIALGVRVIEIEGAESLTLKRSAIRNLPFGLMTFFLLIPLWGWLIAFLVGVPLIALEAYLMIRVPRGQRLGDAMAGTEVVEILVSRG